MSHVISAIRPGWVVPGGRVAIDGRHFPSLPDGPPHVLVGSLDAHVTGASPTAIRFTVPADAEGGRTAVHINELPGERAEINVARLLATGLHLVDNPAFDASGRLYVTQSGGRGSKVPVPLYRLAADGVREPLAVEVANPTSLALGPDGGLYISSRFDGHVYRLLDDDRVEIYATELGVPTGLAFDADGSLFVGDRSGTILRVSPDRTVETFAQLPASVAAFHLAIGPDRCLYVAAPTFATHDPIYRITPERLVDVINDQLGRPQGLAFDSTGTLYAVDALAGAAGLYKIDVSASAPQAELVLTAPALVGLAFDPAGGLVLASNDNVWRLDVGLKPLEKH